MFSLDPAVAQPAAQAPVNEAQPAAQYTLEQILQGLGQRHLKYQAIPLRIQYTRTANDAEKQPPQKTDCTLLIQWNNYREEIRDSQGRIGYRYRIQDRRAEVGRHWAGYELLLPLNKDTVKDLGERIFYHPHDYGFSTDVTVARMVFGPEAEHIAYLRRAEKAGNLKIESAVVNEIPCVKLLAGGVILCLAPQYDWAIVKYREFEAAGFHRADEFWFPTTLSRQMNLKDFKGGFDFFYETCEIRSVDRQGSFSPDLWLIPEPKPGMWIKVGYPRWQPRWEKPAAKIATNQVLDAVHAEHSFTWKESLPPKDARIYEVSRYWRDKNQLKLAVNSDPAQVEGCQTPLPFLTADNQRVIWATYDAQNQQMLKFGQALEARTVSTNGLQFQAGFFPERPEIILGEPLFITFYVTNAGAQPFYLETGGDSRGVRSDRFQFWAMDAEGHRAPDPHPNAAHFGGMQGPPPEVAPGQGYREKIYLPLWLKFDRPGEYIVRGRRVLQLLKEQGFSHDYAAVHPLLADFKLTVLPKDPVRLGRRIQELAAKLNAAEKEIVTAAARQLADLEDERVVAHLVQVIEQGREEATAEAVRGLAKYPGAETVRALEKALKMPGDSHVRAQAAEAMAGMKSDAAVDALIRALTDDNESVQQAAAAALGKIGQRRAVEPLTKQLAAASMNARLACVEALLALGESFQAAWITPIIRSKRPVFQNAIWVVRRNAGQDAPAILADCLDLANPSGTNYYNYTLVWQIHACGGPKLTYHHNFDKEGTPEQIATNRQTLQALQEWLNSRSSPKK